LQNGPLFCERLRPSASLNPGYDRRDRRGE
jgi:hypothetical protein